MLGKNTVYIKKKYHLEALPCPEKSYNGLDPILESR